MSIKAEKLRKMGLGLLRSQGGEGVEVQIRMIVRVSWFLEPKLVLAIVYLIQYSSNPFFSVLKYDVYFISQNIF